MALTPRNTTMLGGAPVTPALIDSLRKLTPQAHQRESRDVRRLGGRCARHGALDLVAVRPW